MARKALPLIGYKSYRALLAFHTLFLGLKMLPMYMGKTYEEFSQMISEMSQVDQLSMLKTAAKFVPLEKEELEALLGFCTDTNGIPYGPENIENLTPDEIVDIIVTVCGEIGKFKVNFISETEKKNLKISQ